MSFKRFSAGQSAYGQADTPKPDVKEPGSPSEAPTIVHPVTDPDPAPAEVKPPPAR